MRGVCLERANPQKHCTYFRGQQYDSPLLPLPVREQREFADLLWGWQGLSRFFIGFPNLRGADGAVAFCGVLLLCWLRLPLPVAPRSCACLGRLGDHRAACATFAWSGRREQVVPVA
eukprot:s4580_g2.t1